MIRRIVSAKFFALRMWGKNYHHTTTTTDNNTNTKTTTTNTIWTLARP